MKDKHMDIRDGREISGGRIRILSLCREILHGHFHSGNILSVFKSRYGSCWLMQLPRVTEVQSIKISGHYCVTGLSAYRPQENEWQVGYGKPFKVKDLELVANWGGAAFTPRAAARIAG